MLSWTSLVQYVLSLPEWQATAWITGALNRRDFMELGTLILARASHDGPPVSALMLDIDDFKKINDRHGHETGDEVLRMFAGVCIKSLPPTDILAR